MGESEITRWERGIVQERDSQSSGEKGRVTERGGQMNVQADGYMHARTRPRTQNTHGRLHERKR